MHRTKQNRGHLRRCDAMCLYICILVYVCMRVMICISVVTSALARRCANKKEAITELRGHSCDLYTVVICIHMFISCIYMCIRMHLVICIYLSMYICRF